MKIRNLLLLNTLLAFHPLTGAWNTLDDFSDPAQSMKKWKITKTGTGNAEFIELDGRRILKLALPKGKNKRISLELMDVPPIPRNGRLVIAFDMKLNWQGTAQGYRNSLWFGTGNEYVIAGQNGLCNHGKERQKFYLNDRNSDFTGNDKWYHYRLTIGRDHQELAVYEQEDGEKPIVNLSADKHLPRYGNTLCVNMGSMFSPDSYAGNRGEMLLDNLKYRAEPGNIRTIDVNGGHFKLVFNRDSGVLEHLRYDEGDLASTCDRYELQLRERRIIAIESRNKLSKLIRTADGIIMEATNPALPGINIRQEYRIENSEVHKKVTFTADGDIDGFLSYFAGTELTPEFRKGSIYQTLRGWDVKTITDADEIRNIITIGHPQANWGSKVITASRPDKGLTLAHFAWKWNGRYTWLITQMLRQSSHYTPSGWYFPTMIFHPVKEGVNSFETVYQVIRGSHLDFYENYRDRPEVAALIATTYPEWLNDTKFDIVCWRNPIGEYASKLQKLLNLSRYSPQENALMTIWGWTGWGEFPVHDNDAVYTGVDGKRQEIRARDFADQLAAARQANPSIKIGLYQLLWSLPPDAVKKHPDWIAWNPDGKPVQMRTEPGWTPIYRRLGNPDSKRSILDGMSAIWKYYPIDYMYIDGGVRGQSYPDWKTMQCDDASEWLDLWKQIYERITAEHPEYALFCNNPFPIYSHAGYSENGSFGHWYAKDWRCLADIFCLVKSFQLPGRFLSVLYRTTGHRSNEPQYTNMLLAAGLTPAGSRDPAIHPDFNDLAGYLSYINAAFELRGTVMKNAVLDPLYYMPGAKVQAHVLNLRGTVMISALRHRGESGPVTIKINTAKAGLKPGAVYYLHEAEVRPAEIKPVPERFNKNGPIALEQVIETRPAGRIIIDGKIFTRKLELSPNRLKFLILTESNARITAVNGRPTQFQMPSLLKADIRAVLMDDRITLGIDNPYDNITVRVELPPHMLEQSVTVNPKGIAFSRKNGGALDLTIPGNIKQATIAIR